jgi:hypothetical protein
MIRAGVLSLLAALVCGPAAPEPTAGWRFRWQPEQVLTYRVEQITAAADTTAGGKVEKTSTRLHLTKRWQVLAVDAAGVATVQKSLTALRLETTRPDGEVLLFDSANPDQSDPQLREQLQRYVEQPLAVLRVDTQGRVVEVLDSKHGPASRFESEPPFLFTLPDAGPSTGQTWERAYRITLDPPQGTGEKYEAVQAYVCKSLAGGAATVALTTVLKTMPESLLDRVPLLQMQPEGELVFDTQAGLLRRAHLRIEKELAGHQGEGSSYRFQSTYTEEYAGHP